MLHQQLSNAWRFRERAFPISTVLTLTPEGLVLGAGTVVLPTEASRRLKSVNGDELRLLTLLSAAYGRAIAPHVLGNIERAAKAWHEGDDCLAYIHLAHARFPTLDDSREAARRLFIADAFMKAGAHPRAVFEALALDPTVIDAVEKLYNPAQPRVPAGSGRISGQWTRVGSFLSDLAAAARGALGRFATTLIARAGGAATVAFGLLFIPSPNKMRVEGEVPGLPGLRYGWNRDERSLQFTYDSGDGKQRTFSAQLEDDVFRDEHSHVVGRVLPDGTVAIEAATIFSDLQDEDEPKLCPAPGNAAANGRPIRWYFAEPEAAAFARKIFEGAKGGREKIEIEVRPWPGSKG